VFDWFAIIENGLHTECLACVAYVNVYKGDTYCWPRIWC